MADPGRLLESVGGTTVEEYAAEGVIFRQRDPCVDVGYVQAGGVKLSVTSSTGREGIMGLLRPADFFGEGCLAGQPVRAVSATALLPSTILRLPKPTLLRVLWEQNGLSDRFIAHGLAPNIGIQEDS